MTASLQVEDLERYGAPVNEFPPAAQRAQARIFLRELRARYGTLALPRLALDVWRERRRFRRGHAVTLRRLESEMGPGIVKETTVLVSLFEAIAAREGRAAAYPVIRAMVDEVAPHSMRAMYQIDELTRCDGDVYENFKRFHLEMFDADVTQQLFPNLQVDEGDHFRTIVGRCANVDVFAELGYPELAPFGCDHDLAGYPAVTAAAGIEFRRPCTIAKGGDHCEFLFYRAGSAPETELVDGVPVRWNVELNR